MRVSKGALILWALLFYFPNPVFSWTAETCPWYTPPSTVSSSKQWKETTYNTTSCSAWGIAWASHNSPFVYAGVHTSPVYPSADCKVNITQFGSPAGQASTTGVWFDDCPSGYTLSGSTCNLTDSSVVSCPPPPACGTNGTTYAADHAAGRCLSDTPETCPGLGEVHHPVDGHCVVPPECTLPQAIDYSSMTCKDPACGELQHYDAALKRCVTVPPTCGANQHLVGDSKSSFKPYCEDNPTCSDSAQKYGCVEGVCGCYGPRDCPDGKVWGTVGSIAGCYGGHLDPSPLPTPTGSPRPSPAPPTPPTGGKCTDCGPATYPSPTPGATGPTGSGSGTGSGDGDKPCSGDYCKCNPSASYGVGEEACPSSGKCPAGMFSTPGGACTSNKASGGCGAGMHYEFESLTCVKDTSSTPGSGSDDNDALASRLDKIIDNTKRVADTFSSKLTSKAPGSFGTDADDALTAARTEFDHKFSEVKSGLSGAIGDLAEGSGVLPSFELGTIRGVVVGVDFNKWSSALNVVPPIIIAIAWLVALTIILSRK